MPYIVLGGGANMLVSDLGVRGWSFSIGPRRSSSPSATSRRVWKLIQAWCWRQWRVIVSNAGWLDSSGLSACPARLAAPLSAMPARTAATPVPICTWQRSCGAGCPGILDTPPTGIWLSPERTETYLRRPSDRWCCRRCLTLKRDHRTNLERRANEYIAKRKSSNRPAPRWAACSRIRPMTMRAG